MRTYKEHYEAAKDNHNINSSSKYNDVYDLRLDENIFEKSDEYLDLVKKIADQVHEKLENKDDIVENQWATHLNGWRDIKELDELFNLIMPEIEQKVFKSVRLWNSGSWLQRKRRWWVG